MLTKKSILSKISKTKMLNFPFTFTLTKFNFAKILIPALILHNIDDTFHLLIFYFHYILLLCCTTVLYYCVLLLCTTSVYYFCVLLHCILTLHTFAGYYYCNTLLLLTKQELK